VIVDQSRTDDSEQIVRTAMAEHDGIEYVRSTLTGAATARNEGAAHVREDLMLFTDDDCEVDPDWARRWAELFESDPKIGLGFGTVSAPPYDATEGLIPTFDPGPVPRTFGPEVLRRGPINLGMGANMAARRSAWLQVGGLDDHFGPGTAFPAAEETDMAVRVLDAHLAIAHAPGPRVIHHGFRRASAAPKLYHGYWLAGGAMYGKHIRSGDRRAIMWALRDLSGLSFEAARKAVTGVRPTGANAARFLVKGLYLSTRTPVDKRLRMYEPQLEFASAR